MHKENDSPVLAIPAAHLPLDQPPKTPTGHSGSYRPHSSSLSSSIPQRSSRRKSVSSTLTPGALAALSISETGVPISASRRPALTSFADHPASLPSPAPPLADKLAEDMTKAASCAVADGPPLNVASLSSIPTGGINKSRIRRASEGSRLSKTDGRRAKDIELKCEKCGKCYKHSSCLTKHLWEHTPQWALTSKLLISKHQQVQLLEAASVLVQMNQDAAASRPIVKSESALNSPTNLGSSPDREINDTAVSSTNTSPPPTSGISNLRFMQQQQHQHYQSYHYPKQNLDRDYRIDRDGAHPFHVSESAPGGAGYMTQYRTSHFQTGHSYGDSLPGETSVPSSFDASQFSSSRNSSQPLPMDAPPVPPLPERFLGKSTGWASLPIRSPLDSLSYSPSQPISFQRGVPPERPPVSPLDDGRFAPEGRSASPIAEEEEDGAEKWRDEDEGVFGRMDDD